MDIKALQRKVEEAGVIGAGGAGFPTHVKLANPAQTVIVNGAECEPLLEVDVQLMERESGRLIEALSSVVGALGARRGVVALKGKHKRVVARLQSLLDGRENLRLHELGDYYPAGDEQILVYEVLGKVVPEGGIPLQVGAVVINVETLLNAEAAGRGIPVTRSYVTVAGAVKEPGTFLVPVGSPVKDLITLAGGSTVFSYRVIEGGPMTGQLLPVEAVASGEAAVQKTTKGLIVLPGDHLLVRRRETSLAAILQQAQAACCQCRICTDMCPRYLLGHSLEPSRVLNAVNHGMGADTEAITAAFLCSECGVCDFYACPVELSPRRMYQALKAELIRQGARNPHHRQPADARATRYGRLVPVLRLLERLDLTDYAVGAPWREVNYSPARVVISLRQHIGAPAEAVVQAGDRVQEGDLIARPPANTLGARVHASIAGRVMEVRDRELIVIAVN